MNCNYRHDINALRSMAVLLVTFYHFDIPGFSGGFIGVDIFFVISGFLMSMIIFDDLVRGRFSVFSFYWGRAKRIMPALIGLCTILLVAGYFSLLPSDYTQLGKHIASSLGFISNWVYFSESGYFDQVSHDKWLLHTWSLSVEWQFYLIFPLIMAVLIRYTNRNRWLPILIVATLLLYFLSIYVTRVNPTKAFFLLPSRAYELLSGGVVYFLSRYAVDSRKHIAWSLTGWLLIIFCVINVDKQTSWPGIAASVPVIGTMLVIFGEKPGIFFIRSKIVQAVGLWSYSIYLWHWPVVVALGYQELTQELFWKLVGLIVAIFLGCLSYYSIEVPSRLKLSYVKRSSGFFSLFSITAIISLGAVAVYISGGGVNRNIPNSALLAENEKTNNQRFDKNGHQCIQPLDGNLHSCIYGKGEVGAIVIGDSHSAAIVTAIEYAYSFREVSVLHWGFNACPTMLGVRHQNKRFSRCAQFNANVLAALKSEHRDVPVIIINRWSAYLKGPSQYEDNAGIRFINFEDGETEEGFRINFQNALTKSLCDIKSSGRNVYLMLPIPEMPYSVPNHMSRKAMMTGRGVDAMISVSEYDQRNNETISLLTTVANQCGVTILDPKPYFCRNDLCIGSINGRPLYVDNNHLSEYGNKLLVPLINDVAVDAR